MTLQALPSTTLIYDNVEFNFNPYYNRVLTLLTEVFPSEDMTEAQKIDITVRSLSDAVPSEGVFELILHELFPDVGKKNTRDKTMDFEQDAALIYAAFLQTYHIDLYAERNRMDWRIFTALLRGIPENTELARVIKLRSTKIPEINKHNREYVESLIEAKRAVALKLTPEERKRRMNQKWLEIAEGLMNVRR